MNCLKRTIVIFFQIISEFLKRATHYYSVSFRSSVCVPSTCSREEIQKIANKGEFITSKF